MKKSFYLFIIFVSLISSININAQEARFDSLVTSGIKQIYGIDFTRAENTFKKVISDYPDKPAGQFFLAMIDWWKILLDPDNESYDDQFYQKLDKVIDQCDDLLDKNSDNVEALFFKGGAIGFRGRLRAFRESWLKAADDGREALPLVTRAGKLDPKKVDVQLGYGIYNYYAAVLPEKYSMLKPVMLFFPSGDKMKGIKQLEYVSRDGQYAKYEARYFLMGIYYQFENNPSMSQKYAEMLTDEFPDNPVFERWLGRIYSKEGNREKAFVIFMNVLQKAKKKLTGYTLKPVIREADYYVGYNYRLNGNLDSAKIYFLDCANISKEIDKKEESGFLINSYLYLGMINDSKGNREKAKEYYKMLLDMKDYSNSKEKAEQYLKNPYK